MFTTAWVAAGLVQSHYSPRREDISALAAETADHAWLMIAGLVVTGLLVVAFAPAVYRLLPQRRIRLVGAGLVLFAGVGTIGLGPLRNDCSTRTAACAARVDAGTVSWHHTAHDVLSGPVFACAVVAPVVVAAALRRDRRLTGFASFSLAVGVVLGVLFTVGGLNTIPGWHGVVQRVAVSIALAWLGVVAVVTLLRERRL